MANGRGTIFQKVSTGWVRRVIENALQNGMLDLTVDNVVINVANLPTSSTGLTVGDLWNNAGVVNVKL